jgi:glycosyltransferase involved in cell wall biosynthesis
MLKRCIKSLKNADVPSGWNVDVLLIMNTAAPLKKSWQGVRYIHEPKIGLSSARNRAIEDCIRRKRDRIIFIDDDTWVSEDWLEKLIDNEKIQCPILHGNIEYIYFGAAPIWHKSKKPRHFSLLKCACTNNVMIDLDICRDGLRFDEAYNYTGGEDTDFFLRAKEEGAEIIYIADANIYEEVPKERHKLKGYLWRGYWCASVQMYSALRNGGVCSHSMKGNVIINYCSVVLKKMPKILTRLIAGITMIILSPLFIVRGKNGFLLMAIKGLNKLTFVAGSIAGLTPWKPLPYKFKEEK